LSMGKGQLRPRLSTSLAMVYSVRMVVFIF